MLQPYYDYATVPIMTKIRLRYGPIATTIRLHYGPITNTLRKLFWRLPYVKYFHLIAVELINIRLCKTNRMIMNFTANGNAFSMFYGKVRMFYFQFY